MQSTLRTKLAAAAIVLVPVGAMLAAQPAAAQGRDDFYRHGQRWEHRDRNAPEIYSVTPDQGDRVGDRGWTRISARFSDDRSGVDQGSVTLRVDGRDVTGRARIDGDDIRYAEDLRPGRHTAELLVRDRAGNVARRGWSFAVVDTDRGGYGYGYGRGYDGGYRR
jgi:hypothetical protein